MTTRRNRVPLTVALTAYDHVYEVTSGEVDLAGVDPTFVDLPTPSSFEEFSATLAWDVGDMPLGSYLERRLAGDERITALPVFTSRASAYRCFYVRRDRIRSPEDLRGARVGTTDWGTTECVYARGLLGDMYGIEPAEVSWLQVTADRAQDSEARTPTLPRNVSIASEPNRTLESLLEEGEIDAIIAPRYALESGTGDGQGIVGRLFERPAEAEREYIRRTSVFPITRVLGVRAELLEQHRWLATNIFRAFEVARRRYFARLEDVRASRVPIPSVAGHVRALRSVFGAEIWPYGVAGNRATLDTFVRYAATQGLIADEAVDVPDLFAAVEAFVDGV
jgi:4,5-dihydroxyphthalate decarboxylase